MKYLLLLLILFPLLSFAAPGEIDRIANYYLLYRADSSVAPTAGKVQVECHFYGGSPELPHQLLYGLNGSSEVASLDSNNQLVLYPQPGMYLFRFYYNGSFAEIEIDSAEVQPGVLTLIILNFMPAYEEYPMKKPVIYLYPETATDVTVQLHTGGKQVFTYPVLEGAWKFTAQPDGNLVFAHQTVPYLFWEADLPIRNPFDSSQDGFIVHGSEATTFLEEKLSAMGLNANEQTDFITFWGPQLATHPINRVVFVLNDACDAYATLNISPQPAHVNRLYMIWQPISAEGILLQPQELPVLNREGFDVLEWGGMELDYEELVIN